MGENSQLVSQPNKTPIFLMPGYDGDGTHSFSKLKLLLDKSYEVHIINFPYRTTPQKIFSLDELAMYVYEQLKIDAVSSAHLVGFSMGGFVAARFAQLFPQLVLSLSLISSSVELSLSRKRNVLLTLTSPFLKNRYIANTFASLYCSPLLRRVIQHIPVPVPQGNFSSKEGYAVFGTLAEVLNEMRRKQPAGKLDGLTFSRQALLFSDDFSMPAKLYQPILARHGFAVQINPTGGHALTPDYWQQVALFLSAKLQ